MRTRLATIVSAALVVAPMLLAGQQSVDAKCNVKPGNSLVSSAMRDLQDAAKMKSDPDKEKRLQSALRSLTQALTTEGQDKNPGVWYFLGRYYVARNDPLGADSAFTRAESMLPDCKDDIQFWRRNWLWIPAYKAGVTALNEQQYDSAIVKLRIANQVYDKEPAGFSALAAAFFNSGHPDSAAKYFRRTIEVASDTQHVSERKDAMFNLANSFYIAQQYDSAAAAYDAYLQVAPNDVLALTRLADVLANSGHQDSAMSVYREVMANPDSVDAATLFTIGVSIYNAAPPRPDTADIGTKCRNERRGGRTLTVALRRQINTACDSVTTSAMRERLSQAATNYALAARAFRAGLRQNPYSRDGLFNLGNSYLALRQTDTSMADSMLSVAKQLVVLDPMNRNSVRLLAQAWQLRGNSDSALHYVILADSLLPVDLTITQFNPGDKEMSINGLLTNYHETPVDSMQIVFQFLNKAGDVVDTQTLAVPSLPAGGNHPFQVHATGEGIIAWRYKRT
jgi:tetratricopeptide (TPR) repeat protein